MNIRARLVRAHIFICASEARCIVRTYMVWGWSWGSLIVVPTGADVAGAYSRLSLILSLSLFLFAASLRRSLSTSFYVFFSPVSLLFLSLWLDQMERCSSPNLSRSGSQRSKSCDLACHLLPLYFFSLCLCLSRSVPSFPVSFPPRQRQTKAFHFSLALLALSVFVLYQTRLPLSLCSLLLFPKKVSRGPRAPALRQGACLSPDEGGDGSGGWEGSAWWAREGRKSKSKYIISFSALELGWDLGGKPRGSVCDKGATSRNLGTIHASRRFHPTRGVC